MANFTLAALKSELDSDPLGRDYANMNDVRVAKSLSDKNRTKVGMASRAVLIRWLARHGGWSKLKSAASSGSPASRSIANAAMLMVQFMDELDLSDAEIDGMFDQLVADGVFKAAEKADLVSLATVPASRAEELWEDRRAVTPSEVADARRLP